MVEEDSAHHAVAVLPTPVLNTPEFPAVFGGGEGKTLHLDGDGLIREVEFIALPATPFTIEKVFTRGTATIYQVTTGDYPYASPGGYYVDSRFVEIWKDRPPDRQKELPPHNDILARLIAAEGSPYLWGGNCPEGIPQMISFYPPRTPLAPDERDRWMLKGLDCSGLLYQATDGWTPRNTSSLITFGQAVPIAHLTAPQIIQAVEPLDIIVWQGHVVIILDRDRAIESRLDYDENQAGNQGGVRIRKLEAVLDELLRERMPVNSYDDKRASEEKRFVIRRWYTSAQMNREPAGGNTGTQKVVELNTTCALDLYRHLATDRENLFFSPYSISTALAMTYAGARGETAQQMAKALHFLPEHSPVHPAFSSIRSQVEQEQGKGGVELSIANGLWVEKNYSLLKGYHDLTDKHYGAVLNRVDFKHATEQARLQINAWVEEKTKNRIKDLLPPGVLDPLTRLVLTNAIYFKGNWLSRFKKDKTRDEQFFIAPDKQVTVRMMNQQADFGYTETETLQVLELPYVGERLSMILLLPRTIDGLGELESILTPGLLTALLSPVRKRDVQVCLPAFTMTSQFDLARTLKAMGMQEAFTAAADFSGMTGSTDLYISAAVHKAFIEVNEEGTEAAAATALVMRLTAVQAPPPRFRADHPFLFLIRHNPTGSILFMGRLANPSM